MNRDGNVVATVRRLKKISQLKLATDLGVGVDLISRLERGDERVEIETRARVAKYLELDFDWSANVIVPPEDLPPEAYQRAVPKWATDAASRGQLPVLDETPTALIAAAERLSHEGRVALAKALGPDVLREALGEEKPADEPLTGPLGKKVREGRGKK